MKSPFKFLDSFTKEDREIFFGREKEIEELYQRIFRSKIMLVYGVSGTGKSSLINCGLSNKFHDEDWLPLNIRRGKNILESMYAAILAASLTPKSQYSASEIQFRKYVKSLYLDHYKPIYFIFDQFEELFIFGTKEEKSLFVRVIKTLIDSDIQCRFIFVMREEYMANVTEFEKHIPVFFSNRVRIENMDINNAIQAIKGPCKVSNISIEEGFSEALIENLSPGSPDIELTYLQVFLDKVYRLSVAEMETGKGENKNISFTIDQLRKIGNVSDLLGTFLNEQISLLDDPDAALAVLKSFVSVKGTKRQMNLDEVQEYSQTLGKPISGPVLLEMLQNFVNLRILRDKDQHYRYELRHDSLATKIYEKISGVEKDILEIRQFIEDGYHNWQKRGILLSANDLDYIGPYESRLFLSSELLNLITQSKNQLEKVKKKRRAIFVTSTFVLLIAFAGFTIWALIERNKSRQQEIIAKSNYYFASSKEIVKRDPTIAINLADAAYKLDPSENNYQNLIDIYSNNEFYDIISSGKSDYYYYRTLSKVGENGSYAFADGRDIKLSSQRGSLLIQWTSDINFYDFDISPDLKYCMIQGTDDTLRIFNSNNSVILKKSFTGTYYNTKYVKARFLSDSKRFFVQLIDGIVIFLLNGEMIAETNRFNYDSSFFKVYSTTSVNRFKILSDSCIYTWNSDRNAFQKIKLSISGQAKLSPYSSQLLSDEKIAVRSSDNMLHIFDSSGTALNSWSLPLNEYIFNTIFINSKYFLAIGENSLNIWDYAGNRIKSLLIKNAYEYQDNIFFDSANDRLIFSKKGNVLSWKTNQNRSEIIFTAKGSDNFFCSFNHIIKRLNDNTFEIDSITGSYLRTLKISTKKAFWPSKSLQLYAVSDPSETTANVYDFSGRAKCSIDLINKPIGLIEFSPNDELFVTVGNQNDNYFTLWNLKGKKLRAIGDQGENIYQVEFSGDNRYLISRTYGDLATLWDTSGRKICQLVHPDIISSTDISNDGSLIVTGCADGLARLWNKEGRLLGVFGSPEKNTYVGVKFNPPGSLFVMTDGKNMKFYNLKGNLQNTLAIKNGEVFFSDKNSEVFIADYEKGVSKVKLRESLDSFLLGKELFKLSIEDKLKYNIITINEAFKMSDPDELYEAGNFYLNTALQTIDAVLREEFFNNAEKFFIKGSSLDSLPVRFYLRQSDLLVKKSSYTGVEYFSDLENIFANIIKSNDFHELKDAVNYYYLNSNMATYIYNFPKKIIVLLNKLLRLYPDKNRYIFRGYEEYAFRLVKSKRNKEALDFDILARKSIPDNVLVNTYLPLCYLMNDSIETAKKLYLAWKDKDLPLGWASKREPKYGDYFKSDLRTVYNSGIKINDYDTIVELLGGSLK